MEVVELGRADKPVRDGMVFESVVRKAFDCVPNLRRAYLVWLIFLLRYSRAAQAPLFSWLTAQLRISYFSVFELERAHVWFTLPINYLETHKAYKVAYYKLCYLRNLFPALRTPLERFRRHMSESSEELAPLKVWQMQALSMQAAAAVVDAHDSGGDEALKVLTSIAQNFPMQVRLFRYY